MNKCSELFINIIAHFNFKIVLLIIAFMMGNSPGAFSQNSTPNHRELAGGIIQKMRLSDDYRTNRLIEATVEYLEELEDLLNERAVTLSSIEENHKDDSFEKDSLIVKAFEVARYRYSPLKKRYVELLQDDLTPYQVERVKDGLTHDAFPNFHAMYLEMVPSLKPAEKAQILALLVEGRENAMLAISEEGQTQWWDKYRGIINNYIASQGYDFGKLSKSWDKANPDKEWAH